MKPKKSDKIEQLIQEGVINIMLFKFDDVIELELDHDSSWARKLLLELNEQASELSDEEKINQSSIKIDLKITKTRDHQWDDLLTAQASFYAEYKTHCVKSLELMTDSLRFDLDFCFINQSFETDEQLAEQTEIYIGSQNYELYFFKNNLANVAESIHEHAFLNLNQFPSAIND